MDPLLFRRQFLFSPHACPKFSTWQTEQVGTYHLYVHPDCQVNSVYNEKVSLHLIGYILDPHHPEKSSPDILTEMLGQNMSEITNRLYFLTGRYVLIIHQDNDCSFFHDPCGLKTLYYTRQDGKFYAASQPLLIEQVLPLVKSPTYETYFRSQYVKNHIEHWLPSGLSLYENVYHLIPNHSVSISDSQQKRYWPTKELHQGDYSQLRSQFSSLLSNIMQSANNNMDLALSLTAGWDSRIILSCCDDIADDIFFYTLRYRGMDEDHNDIRIPAALSAKLGLDYSVLDCEQKVTDGFREIYEQNTHIAHFNDWGKIAFGMLQSFPQNRVAVKGNCSETGRCFYYSNGKHTGPFRKNIYCLEKDWAELDFMTSHIKDWVTRTQEETGKLGYIIYDLFYWEHKMGSWQAQSQLEWDIAQEVFTPFNSRELMDIMFSIDTSYRKKSKPILYRDAMKQLWPDVLTEPINPPKKRVKRLWKKLKKKFN